MLRRLPWTWISYQAGMVSLTIVPCRCSVSRSPGPGAPYIVSWPVPELTHSFRPGFPISVTVIQRPMPRVGTPVPDTNPWTPMASASFSSGGSSGGCARVARMPGPWSEMTTSKVTPLRGQVPDVGVGALRCHAVLVGKYVVGEAGFGPPGPGGNGDGIWTVVARFRGDPR